MSAILESTVAAEPRKPLIARINWVKAAPWLYTLALFVLWELLVHALKMPPTILPSPVRVGQAIMQYWSPIWKNSLQTLYTTTLGFAIAVAAGLAIGLFIGWSKTIYAGLYPLMIGFNAIPKVALVPILVIWFGIGTVPAVLTAFLISFFPKGGRSRQRDEGASSRLIAGGAPHLLLRGIFSPAGRRKAHCPMVERCAQPVMRFSSQAIIAYMTMPSTASISRPAKTSGTLNWLWAELIMLPRP